jgi:ZIP family zinc transporter
MDEWLKVTLLTLMAGLAMPAGAILAWFERIRPRWLENELRHGVIAFGGGALLAAVALVLVPEGMKDLPTYGVISWFFIGAIAFMTLDIVLARRGTHASQFVAMVSDFLPEALALGATFVGRPAEGLLLALIIALQNMPEGFNAYRELRCSTQYSSRRIIGFMALMALMGPICGLIGLHFLADDPQTVAAIMLFAAGGILYLIFQDIAPQARLRNHWAPPLGAVGGFLLGILGKIALT